MKRFAVISAILLVLSSCTHFAKKESIEELVLFGYSGFCIKDSTNWVYDSTRLDIREYFEYKKDSSIKIAIRKPFNKSEYHSVITSDTIGLEKLIQSTFLNTKFKKEYLFSEFGMYDGWCYTLFYKTTNHKEHFIDYVPSELPHNLRLLHDFIVKIITAEHSILTDPFEFNPITATVAIRLHHKYPREKTINSSINLYPPRILPDTTLPDSK